VNRAVGIDTNIQDRAGDKWRKATTYELAPKIGDISLQRNRETAIDQEGLPETSGAIPCSPALAFGPGTERCYWDYGRFVRTTLPGGVMWLPTSHHVNSSRLHQSSLVQRKPYLFSHKSWHLCSDRSCHRTKLDFRLSRLSLCILRD
jgi:hypothetical protein